MTPPWSRFCLFLPCPPPRSVVTPPQWRFCLFLPCPPPRSVVTPPSKHLKGRLGPRVGTSRSFRAFHGFWLVSMVFQGSRLVFHGFSPECTRPKLYPGLAHRYAIFLLKYSIGWRPKKDSIEKRPDWEKTRLRKDQIEKRPDWETWRLSDARFETIPTNRSRRV